MRGLTLSRKKDKNQYPRDKDNRSISQYNRKYTTTRSITGIDRTLRTPSSCRDENRGEVYWIYLPENNY